jgi:regulator of sigma E protease
MNWYILAIIPILGLLVFVHELGHFLSAKWAGIRVEEFALGFPPAIVSMRKRERGGWEVIWFGRSREDDAGNVQNPFAATSGGASKQVDVPDRTLYTLNLLPIGGYVRMPGENGEAYDEGGNYDEKSFAAKSAGKRIIVLCAGVVMNLLLAIVLFTIAYGMGEPTYPAVLGTIQTNSPAATAGLRADDSILAVNGKAVSDFDGMRTAVSKEIESALAKDKNLQSVPITLQVRHNGEKQPVTIVVNARAHPAADQGALGVTGKIVLNPAPLWEAPFKGIARTFEAMRLFVSTLGQMVIGLIPFQVSGPVGIARITGDVAQSVPIAGWWPILNLTAMLSLNLAIVNILPFPALDGGRVVLILIEMLRGGKRMRPEREGLINFVGLAVLLLVMVAVTVSDVIHWGS